MADYTSQSRSLSSPIQNYPKSSVPSFFDSPRFRVFSGKALFETESVLSPTSILDPKPFSAFKNPFSGDGNRSQSPRNFSDDKQYLKTPDSDGIGLALVSKLPSDGKVLFGANLKIQIPPLSSSISLSGSPSSGPLLNGFSKAAIKTKTSSPSPSSSPEAVELISVSEMKLSEEYTCVISHGSNPKTTHIFDNCIVESFCDFSDQPNPLSKSFLSFCNTCKKDLEQKSDIFIYRGEKAFCSAECRHQEMILDGIENSDFF